MESRCEGMECCKIGERSRDSFCTIAISLCYKEEVVVVLQAGRAEQSSLWWKIPPCLPATLLLPTPLQHLNVASNVSLCRDLTKDMCIVSLPFQIVYYSLYAIVYQGSDVLFYCFSYPLYNLPPNIKILWKNKQNLFISLSG